jgi:V/A-type H+-transporting ATPase subunit F
MNDVELLVIGDETVVYGFSLLGIDGRIVHSVEEAESALDEVMQADADAIVLITAQWAQAMRPHVDIFKGTSLHPLVLELPTDMSKMGEQATLRTLLQQALGVRLE